jgi:hypothetical protein
MSNNITPDWSIVPKIETPQIGQESQFNQTHGLKSKNINISTTKIIIGDGTTDRILIGEF